MRWLYSGRSQTAHRAQPGFEAPVFCFEPILTYLPRLITRLWGRKLV